VIYSPEFDHSSIRHTRLFKMIRKLPERAQDLLRALRAKFVKELTFHDYDTVWQQIIKIRHEEGLDTFPGAFVDWDNTPRYKERATIFRGATPEAFRKWFGKLVESMPARHLPENYIFLNAWNEWSASCTSRD
jgi:Glycosyltransferase WbsX